MNRNFIMIFLLVSAICGCSSAKDRRHIQVNAIPYRLDDSEKNAVIVGVKSRLKDPYSPVFSPMIATKDLDSDNVIHVCGGVNAKNAFGAYSGDTMFFGSISSKGSYNYFSVASLGNNNVTAYMCKIYVLDKF